MAGWTLPALGQASSMGNLSRTGEQIERHFRDFTQAGSWPGLPYFNGLGETNEEVHSESTRVEAAGSFLDQTAIDPRD